jgi:hypothetical protein
MEKALGEMSDPNGRRMQPPTIAWDGYMPGTKSTYNFLFELAPGITLRRTLEDTGFDPNAKVASYDALPADFRNSVVTQYQQMKDNMTQRINRAGQEERAVRGGRGGGQKPPAP